MSTEEPSGRSLRDLEDPLAVIAFSGWNDAGSAATDALLHLMEVSRARSVFSLDPDDFYDFQVNRPTVLRPGHGRTALEWPSTDIWVGRLGGRDLVLITGPEPNLRWRAYAAALVSALRTAKPSMTVMLGALLADNAHSRPVPVSRTSADGRLRARLGLEPPSYEGQTGILGVMAQACQDAGLPTVSLWAAIPHYVSQAPNPKGTMALLERLEDLGDLRIDLRDLPELARAWERGVAEVVNEDTDLAGYVSSLEDEQDETELPQATGDAIAAEFQRYLRRRGSE